MESTVTVSNGEEFFEIPQSDLDEAKADGFYRPHDNGLTIVSDGTDLFEVPLSDVAEAAADGFKDLLAAERLAATASATTATAVAEPPVTEATADTIAGEVPAQPQPVPRAVQTDAAADVDDTIVAASVAAIDDTIDVSAAVVHEVAAESPDEAAAETVAVAIAIEADEEADEEEDDVLAAKARKETIGVIAVNTALHAAVLLILAFIILPPHEEDPAFTVISSTENESEEEPVEEVVELEQPEELTEDTQTEIETDVITDTNAQFDIDISDIDPSTTIQDPTSNAPAPAAKIGSEMGGRSKAGRAALVTKYGGNAASEAAVQAGLKWLANHQNPDGSWSFDHTRLQCQGACTQPGSLKQSHMGATSMALLAFMGAGHTFEDGDYKREVGAALNFMFRNIKLSSDGADLRGASEGNSGMYIQGLATIAMCEALAMSHHASLGRASAKKMEADLKRAEKSKKKSTRKTRLPPIKPSEVQRQLHDAAQLSVNFVMRAQDPKNGGWRYSPRSGGDTSVVGWQVMALASAHSAKLRILPQVLTGVSVYLDSVQTNGGAGYGYSGPQLKPSTTAIGLLCRMYLGWNTNHPALIQGVEYLGAQGPSKNNMYFNYYATQVMHHFGGDHWKKWNDVMRDQIVNSQIKKGHATGSWNLADAHGGSGGRLYMTCLCTMTLEVYYRHLPLYQNMDLVKKTASR